MKKLLSLVLAIILIVTTLTCAMPLSISAEADAIEATPLAIPGTNRGWQYVAAVTTTMPLSFTTANGIVVKQNSVYTTQYAHESDDGAVGSCLRFASMEYASNILFGASTGLIIYVKTDAANQIAPSITSGGKSFTAKVGADYQYAALGATEWTTAQFETGHTGSSYFGKFGFDGAFEGYVKIPYTSIGYDNNPSYVFNPEADTVAQIVFRFKGLGSNGLADSDSTTVYGEAVVGPVFVVTKDSTSTRISVPAEWQPAPIEATPLENVPPANSTANRGWQYIAATTNTMPLDFTTVEGLVLTQNSAYAHQYPHETEDGKVGTCARWASINYTENILLGDSTGIIFYVKFDYANQVVPNIIARGWTFAGKVGSNYQYAAIGADEWTTAQFETGLTGSAFFGKVSFDSAFEGFIKIPYTSLGYDNSPSYVLNPTTDLVSQIIFRFKGLGSNGMADGDSTNVYGDVVVGPIFVVNKDSVSTKIEVPEQYKPQPLNIKTVGFGKVHAAGYGFSAVKVDGTSNYELSLADDKFVENADGKVASAGATALVMNPEVKTYMKDAKGVVFYVKFDSANAFAPNLVFDGTKSYMPKPGSEVQVMAVGSDKWVDKTIEVGHEGNSIIYGMISFDSAFEGYIKIPFSSCNNDGGFKPSFAAGNINPLTSIALRFKGIGGADKYGKVTVGLTGYFTEDTSRPVIGSIALPDYEYGDVNYDWKFDATDIVSARKDLLGYSGFAGYKVSSIKEIIKIKKLLASVTA